MATLPCHTTTFVQNNFKGILEAETLSYPWRELPACDLQIETLRKFLEIPNHDTSGVDSFLLIWQGSLNICMFVSV